ncbi:initiation factor eIF1/SUI [Acanthamoeba castellanii medusavirus]|uniref:Initiation factor eIF1/SUI n=1 Tax=Acanthamoeba castellanii medusavirus J1 TaxID=3114988 RepID=A0A3T1CXH6_9VIRU|nr:initiation factor eIF1/SUI [Acanthamoeba castellanii medusavirus]BBI30533.1 initiation factor eIF1/SUI [Acanthamoeba castellanii medusavirus J1]
MYNPESELDAITGDTTSVHIRVQKRNARSYVTLIEHAPPEHVDKLLQCFRKILCCNGTIIESTEHGRIVQLQGDHRESVGDFLVEKKIVSRDSIKIHGY